MLIKLILFCITSYSLVAHPVIWSGGRVANVMTTPKLTELKFHYTLSRNAAAGGHVLEFADGPTLAMAQFNRLIRRWNADASQGNVYGFLGFGSTIAGKESGVVHLGAQADWETRRVYTYFGYDGFFMREPQQVVKARVGVAPYLANYLAIQPWVLLQVSSIIDGDRHHLTVLPVLRLYKGNVLIELGSNFRDNGLVTAMVHF